MAALMVSGMTGKGSVSHNNRKFYTHNVDKSRTHQNITFQQEDLQDVYHELFDQALDFYNAKKKKTRDKIPDYYEHIRQGKQEKLFHEAIFQIGNKDSCPCGSPEGEQVAEILKDFTRSFQERNPHLRVFNAVLHMDEATPHVHIDFVPFATDQKRGLSTRVSMKQALKQQGFTGSSKQKSEWTRWIESEKQVLEDMAKGRGLEIEHGEGGRPHLDIPTYIAAKRREEEAIARGDELTRQNQRAAENLLRASESLQNAQNQLAVVTDEVKSLSDSRDDLKRSTASLEEVSNAERSAKRNPLTNRVSLPAKEYQLLLSSARASAVNRQDASVAAKEASAAKQRAQRVDAQSRALESEVRRQRAEIARLTPAAKLGEWFAHLFEHTPVPAIVAQWGEDAARMIATVLGKPKQRANSLQDKLDMASAAAKKENQRHSPAIQSRKHNGHEL